MCLTHSYNDFYKECIFLVIMTLITIIVQYLTRQILNWTRLFKPFIIINNQKVINKIIDYMISHESYYEMPQTVVFGKSNEKNLCGLQIDYKQMNDNIYFNDFEYNVSGTIHFYKILLTKDDINNNSTNDKSIDDLKNKAKCDSKNSNTNITSKIDDKCCEKYGLKISFDSKNINAVAYLNKLLEYKLQKIHRLYINELLQLNNYIEKNMKDFPTNRHKYSNSIKQPFIINSLSTNLGVLIKDTKYNIEYYLKCDKNINYNENLYYIDNNNMSTNIDNFKSYNFVVKMASKNNNDDIKCYLKKINDEPCNNKVILHDKLTISKTDYYKCIYNGTYDDKILKEIFIDSFFQKDMKFLWNLVMSIKNNKYLELGQQSNLNLLLYGPSGTGKSSLVYRFAMFLHRQIIHINLENYSKQKLHEIFSRIPTSYINYYPNEVIYVFDEFDISIKNMLQNENMQNKRMQVLRNMLEKRSNFLKQFDNIKNSFEPNEQILDITKYNNDIKLLYEEIKNISSEKISVRDLLTIFQGTCPRYGSIIIGTTNNMEMIRDICPELIRVGRMTPIKFDNFDNELIKSVIKYYYGCDIQIDGEMEIRPSKMMEELIASRIANESVEQYIKKLETDNIKLSVLKTGEMLPIKDFCVDDISQGYSSKMNEIALGIIHVVNGKIIKCKRTNFLLRHRILGKKEITGLKCCDGGDVIEICENYKIINSMLSENGITTIYVR